MGRIRTLAVVLCILALGSCKKTDTERTGKTEKAGPNLTTTKLADIPADVQLAGAVISPYGHKAVYAVTRGGKQIVVDDGKEGAPYDGIRDFVWSPDGRRFAYAGVKGGKFVVVLDGKEGRPYDDVGPPVFSPDGKLVAYEAMRDGKWYIAVGDKESRGADMNYMEPVFSPDGRFVSYFEQHYKENKTFRVVSGIAMANREEGRVHDATGAVALSPDRKQIAYFAWKGGKAFLLRGAIEDVGGEQETGPFDSARFIVFSPDSQKLAYLAGKEGKQLMVIGDRELDYSRHEVIKLPVFSPDGKMLASVCERAVGNGVKQYVLVNDKEGPAYDEVGMPVFSPDSSALAYPARRGEKEFLVVNGIEGPSYDKVLPPVFSPGGSRMAYRVRKDGKRFIVVADKSGKTIREHPAYEAVWQPVFSPDGKSIAYGAAPVLPVKELWWKVEPVE